MLKADLICKEAVHLFLIYRKNKAPDLLRGIKKLSEGRTQRHVDILENRKMLELSIDNFANSCLAPVVKRLAESIPEGTRFLQLEVPKGIDASEQNFNGVSLRVCIATNVFLPFLERDEMLCRIDALFESDVESDV